VGTRERPVDRGRAASVRLLQEIGRELRAGRLDRNLSQREVGRALGCSHSIVHRVEHARSPDATVRSLAEHAAVVGLDLSARLYPGGRPHRDAPQGRLLERLHSRLHPHLRWNLEVPMPDIRDQRAWDAMIRGDQWRFGVEAETGPRDGQSLARRIALKRRDSGVDGVILVLPRTRRTREFLGQFGSLLTGDFPAQGRTILTQLAVGARPEGSGIVVL
jgi:transcriptional regulator with XRE-family HTH domain